MKNIEIPKLDGKNYLTWIATVKAYLKWKDQWEGAMAAKPTDSGELEKWPKLQSQVGGFLQIHIAEALWSKCDKHDTV